MANFVFCDVGNDLYVPSHEFPAPVWVFVGKIEVEYPPHIPNEELVALVLREIRRICRSQEDEMVIFERVVAKKGDNLVLTGKLFRNES